MRTKCLFSSDGESWPADWLHYEINDPARGGSRRLSIEEWLVLADMENSTDGRHIETTSYYILLHFSSALKSDNSWITVPPKGKKDQPQRQMNIPTIQNLTVCFIILTLLVCEPR